jgi:hypothetical protein
VCARGGNLFETSDLKGNATAGAEVLGGGLGIARLAVATADGAATNVLATRLRA